MSKHYTPEMIRTIMTDTSGEYKEDFIRMMCERMIEDQQAHLKVVDAMTKNIRRFLQVYFREDVVQFLEEEDHGDLIAEMNRLSLLLVGVPRNDAELYDKHIAMLRLTSLLTSAITLVKVERQLTSRDFLKRLLPSLDH